MWRTFSWTQSNSKCKCIIRCTHRDRWFCHVPVSYYCKWKNWLFIHSDHYSMSGSVRHQDCHLLFFTPFIFFRPWSTSLKEVLRLYLHVGKNHIGQWGEVHQSNEQSPAGWLLLSVSRVGIEILKVEVACSIKVCETGSHMLFWKHPVISTFCFTRHKIARLQSMDWGPIIHAGKR